MSPLKAAFRHRQGHQRNPRFLAPDSRIVRFSSPGGKLIVSRAGAVYDARCASPSLAPNEDTLRVSIFELSRIGVDVGKTAFFKS